ncbi:MAG: hypothetical protein KF841_16285 [Phycisphaerae bacterium]|nr:hypothetical protein [Phycisphaerae bacterium]
MTIVLFEDAGYRDLLPLVYSRATFNLRCGFDNLRNKIEHAYAAPINAMFVRPEIAPVMVERWSLPVNAAPTSDRQLWINGRVLLSKRIDLPPDCAIWQGDTLVAANLSAAAVKAWTVQTMLDHDKLRAATANLRRLEATAGEFRLIRYPWQLIHANADEINRQFLALGSGEILGNVYAGAHILNDSAVRIGKGSKIKPCTVLDAEDGPIHIGENVNIAPNVTVTGPCFIGDQCTVQAGANIRGGTSIGTFCKVGGEIEGAIFHGYSNKQHDGFVGHSYVGEWVNLGADTVTSDLKNTYGSIKVALNGSEIDTGEMFIGSIIGDHAKTGINTVLPTGCIVGYAANLFASSHPPKFVPSFTWLTDDGRSINEPQKALAVAMKVVARRKRVYSPAEQALFLSVARTAKAIERV